MSERKVIHGAVMAECFHPGFGGLDADLLTDQEPRTGQVAVVVLKAEDHAALTADRDTLRGVLECMAKYCWDGGDLDGDIFFDIMVDAGLMIEVPAPPEWSEVWDSDTMYQLTWRVDP